SPAGPPTRKQSTPCAPSVGRLQSSHTVSAGFNASCAGTRDAVPVRATRRCRHGMDPFYTAAATAKGDGRAGEVLSSDGVLDEELAVPTEMGGSGGRYTNPEQLFAAGYAACFHGALRTAAADAGIDAGASSVTARVGIGKSEVGLYAL